MDVPILDMVLFYVVLLISLVFHEAAHALVALWGGDRTAYIGGQVSLNPVPHIRREPFGMVILPLIVLAYGARSGDLMCMGFAHAPISIAWANRHPRRAALMSLAGPVSNFILALTAIGVLKILLTAGYADHFNWRGPGELITLFITPRGEYQTGAVFAIAKICTVFVFLNGFLGVLNLIPWPPLDGAGVLGGFFPKSLGRLYDLVRSQTILMIAGIAGLFFVAPKIATPVILWFDTLL